jgi:hypothetical protein
VVGTAPGGRRSALRRADGGEGSDADPLPPTDLRRELLDLTLEVWQPLSSRHLSDEDAREILANVTGFFRVLARCDLDMHQSERSEAA